MEAKNSEKDYAEFAEVDAALAEDVLRRKQAVVERSEIAQRETEKIGNLAKIMRGGGSFILIAAAITFLLQRWEAFSHIERYLSFLGFTAVIAGAAVFTWLRFKDDKGTRTFLAVAAAIVPVHFCQLGALIFSQFGVKGAEYPRLLLWQAPSLSAALQTTLLGLLVLVPVTFFAYRVLARSSAGTLAGLYLLANSVLLIPVRGSDFTAAAALILIAAIAWCDLNYFKGAPGLGTFEGRLARLLPLVPVVLLVGRVFYLYSATAFLISSFFAAAALVLFSVVPSYTKSIAEASFWQKTAIVPAATSWLIVVPDLYTALNLDGYGTLLVGLPLAALLLVMGTLAVKPSRIWAKVSAITSVTGVTIQLMTVPQSETVSGFLLSGSNPSSIGLISALISIGVTFAVAAYGAFVKDRLLTIMGSGAFLIGIIYNIRLAAFQLFDSRPWLCLGILGIAAILSASVIEKQPGLIAKAKSLLGVA